MHDLTKQFISALGDLHRDGDVEPLVDLFDQIDASFKHTVTDDGIACLEWTSNGTLADGSEFSYDGVSVLEASGDTIDAFRTYLGMRGSASECLYALSMSTTSTAISDISSSYSPWRRVLLQNGSASDDGHASA